MTAPYVRTHQSGGVCTIEFFHPQGNSLPAQLLSELAQEIHHAGMNADTRVILLRSGGEKAFCGGASFSELSVITTAEQGRAFFSGFAHVFNAMRTCGKMIVARIHGKCVGGGVGLAAAADYAIAHQDADIKLSELTIGIGPFVVGPVIERKTGRAAFGQLAIDAGSWRNADWARRKNIYAEVHESVPALDESVDKLTHTLAHSSPDALTAIRKILWEGTDHWEKLLEERAAISGKLVAGSFAQKALGGK